MFVYLFVYLVFATLLYIFKLLFLAPIFEEVTLAAEYVCLFLGNHTRWQSHGNSVTKI